MSGLTSSEFARRADVNLQTIRFYERKGLLSKPPRAASGYRRFPAEAVGRVRFIKRAQELGFSLAEIKELLALRLDPRATCAEVPSRAEAKLFEVERKIQDLRRMATALAALAVACSGSAGAGTNRCPILQSLDGTARSDVRFAQTRKQIGRISR